MPIGVDRKGGYIQLCDGRPFWPLDPRPEDIVPETIAQSLSKTPRFRGHTQDPTRTYTVGDHILNVSRLLWEETKDATVALWGLVHDWPEAFTGDEPTPNKWRVYWYAGPDDKRYPKSFPEHFIPLSELERGIMGVICDVIGIGREMPPEVKAADRRMLATEVRDLMPPDDEVWGPWIEGIEPYQIDLKRFNFNPNVTRLAILGQFRTLVERIDPKSKFLCQPEEYMK